MEPGPDDAAAAEYMCYRDLKELLPNITDELLKAEIQSIKFK